MTAETVVRWQPSRFHTIGVALGIVLISMVAFVHYLIFPGETYFPLYPAIGTTFSEGYSETGFQQVQAGMTRAEVEALIGKPLRVLPVIDNAQQWEYSVDGGPLGDFAWLYRAVSINAEGTVIGTHEMVMYD